MVRYPRRAHLKTALDFSALDVADEEICLGAAPEYVACDDVGLRDLSCVDIAEQEVHRTQGPAVDVSDDRADPLNIAPADGTDQKVDLLS